MKNLVILAYHKVNDFTTTPLDVKTKNFDIHMNYLKKNKYNVISLEELNKNISGKVSLEQKTACITFDDGHKDNYEFAFPILKKYDYSATIFLTTSFIGKEKFLSWEEIVEMKQKGILFGAHTVNHPRLTQIEYGNAKKEIYESKIIIEKKLGTKCSFFCYPYGDASDNIRKVVIECGFELAFITPPRAGIEENNFFMKRVGIYYHTDMLQYRLKLWGVYSRLKRR